MHGRPITGSSRNSLPMRQTRPSPLALATKAIHANEERSNAVLVQDIKTVQLATVLILCRIGTHQPVNSTLPGRSKSIFPGVGATMSNEHNLCVCVPQHPKPP